MITRSLAARPDAIFDARPPTSTLAAPAQNSKTALLKDDNLGTLTPPQSSPPSSQNDSPTKPPKRVVFCPRSDDPKTAWILAERDLPVPVKHSPPRIPRKPLRSILKNTLRLNLPQAPGSLQDSTTASPLITALRLNPNEPQTPERMLDSALKLLAADTMDLRLDGYQTLNGAFKAYSDLPSLPALRTNLTQIARYIERDITEVPRDTSGMNVITQALKLTIALMHTPSLAANLGLDFQTALLDNALDTLSQPTVIKAIANHFLFMLASQDFNTRIMTAVKIESLLARLENIHERISGNSVIASRLAIYVRLVQQTPTLMHNSFKAWFKHVLHGALSSHKDIRQRAIECGLAAGLAIGNRKQPTDALIDIFASESNEGGTYGEYLMARLSDMLNDKAQRPAVARIWGMIILFMQGRRRPITEWHMFRSWLLIIQRCMNCSDPETKYEASVSWNRLVFVSDLGKTSLEPKAKLPLLLRAPFVGAFGKPATSNSARDAQRIALHSYCNLLYYALQPTQSHDRLDAMWEIYVKPCVPVLLKTGGREAKFAVKIIKNLLQGAPSTWDSQRANNEYALAPADLHRLDPVWVRSRLPTVLSLLEPFFVACLWLKTDGYSVTTTPWPELMAAIVEAGRLEVRASLESKQTLAHLINFFRALWIKASQRTGHGEHYDAWVGRFSELVNTTVKLFGPNSFAEPSLVDNPAASIEPAVTPSRRASKHHQRPQAPLGFLLHLYGKPPGAISDASICQKKAIDLMHTVCLGLPSHEARFSLIRACIPKQLPAENNLPIRALDCFVEVAARIVADTTGLQQSLEDPKVLEHFLMTLTTIFEVKTPDAMIALGPLSGTAAASLEVVCLRLGYDTNVCKTNRMLVYPLVRLVHESAARLSHETRMSYVAFMMTQHQWPGTALGASGADSDRDSFDMMCRLINACCAPVQGPDISSPEMNFIAAFKAWLKPCKAMHVGPALRIVQEGLSEIVSSSDASEINGLDDDIARLVLGELWDVALDKLSGSTTTTLQLKLFSRLLAAGFCSSHRVIVESTIGVWNVMLSQVGEIEYPSPLIDVLDRLRAVVRLSLPGFPSNIAAASIPIPYIDQNETTDVPTFGLDGVTDHRPSDEAEAMANNSSITRSEEDVASEHSVTNQTTGEARQASPAKTMVTVKAPRPRHDDSQVHFCDIQSSPLPVDNNESQHLTTHQVEVANRQQEVSRLYPGIYSSPNPRFARRSDVSSLQFNTVLGGEQPSTPEPANDDTVVDDDVQASPTPKASKTVVNIEQLDIPEAAEGDNESVAEADLDQTMDDVINDDLPAIDILPASAVDDALNVSQPVYDDDSDSDLTELGDDDDNDDDDEAVEETILRGSSQVLKPSEDAASEIEEDEAVPMESEVAETICETAEPTENPADEVSTHLTVIHTDETAAKIDESSIVEASIISAASDKGSIDDEPVMATEAPIETKDVDSPIASSKSSGGKRKRENEPMASTPTSAKRTRRVSPMKQILGRLWGSNGVAEQEEIGDCIVVSNSQPELERTDSFSTPRSSRKTASQPVEPSSEARSRTSRHKARISNASLEPSASPQMTSIRRSKRKSCSQDEELDAIDETPAAKRVRRQLKPSSRLAQTSGIESSLGGSQTSSSSQVLDAVVIPATRDRDRDRSMGHLARVCDADDHERVEASDHGDDDGDKEPSWSREVDNDGHGVNQPNGAISAIGRSIFGKLKDVWKDFSRIALGFEEANQFDGMLQEIRKEVIEAEKRGRGRTG